MQDRTRKTGQRGGTKSSPADKKTTPVEVVYIGRGKSKEGKICRLLLPLARVKECADAQEAWMDSSAFACKVSELPRRIGGIYTIDGDLDDAGKLTRTRGNPVFVAEKGYRVKPEWVAKWEADDKAFQVAERARRLEKELSNQALLNHLEPIRGAYRNTDAIGRLALEVVILDKLRRGF